MKFVSCYVGLLFHETVAREGHSWEAGRWIPNSNFEMAGNNRNQGGLDPNLMNYENGAGTKAGSTLIDCEKNFSFDRIIRISLNPKPSQPVLLNTLILMEIFSKQTLIPESSRN